MEKYNSDKKLLLASVVGMFVIPITVFFVLRYFCEYFSGDIQREALDGVLIFIYNILVKLVNYITFGILLYAVRHKGIKKSGIYIIFACISILLPYISNFFIELFLGSLSYSGEWYLLNLLLYPFDLLTLVLVVLYMPCARRLYKPKKNKEPVVFPKIGYTEKELSNANAFTGILLLLYSLITEIYYTVNFIYELKYEYCRAIDPSELVSMITLYFECFFFAFTGYIIMRLICVLLNRVTRKSKFPK